MVTANTDWWKTIFDETYLVTDGRTVCDDKLTCGEVDFLEEVLKLKKPWPILDLCGGQGRHSLELCRRGFQNLTVLDYSRVLNEIGREKAQKEGLNALFVQKDARNTGFPDEKFRVIIIMASSFGYFIDENQNAKILREAFRILMTKGSLLMDLPNREYVLKNFTPRSWHEADKDIVVCRQRRLEEDIIHSREVVISKREGLIRDATYCIHLYSPQKITTMLTSAGFSSVTIHKDFVSHDEERDYGLMTNRMIVIADKE